MKMYLPTRHRREVLSLQIVAMIDIFAMIIIFLIRGTYFGGEDLPLPPGLKLPASISKEGLESTPRVVIAKEFIEFSLHPQRLTPQEFAQGKAPALDEWKAQSKTHIEKVMPGQKPSGGPLLSILADRSVPYERVFDAAQFFRKAGFEALLFIAEAPER